MTGCNLLELSTVIYRGPLAKQELVKRLLTNFILKEKCPKIVYFASEVALISFAKKKLLHILLLLRKKSIFKKNIF